MTEVASVTGETLSFFHLSNRTQPNCSHVRSLQCTGTQYGSTLRIRMLMHSLCFIPSKSYHCTGCFGFTLGLLFIHSKISLCHSFECLFWILQLHCLMAEPLTKTLSACLRLLHTIFTLSSTEPEFIIQQIRYEMFHKML